MKNIVFLSIAILLFACNTKKNTESQQAMNDGEQIKFFVGTYTNGASEGIYKYVLNANGTLDSICLLAKGNNPSYLTLSSNKKFLIAVNEANNLGKNGVVVSYKIEDDTLIFLSNSSSGGAHPCHIQVNDSGLVAVTNYTGGNVGVLHHDKTGMLSELIDVKQHSGKGSTERQEGPHAHSAWFTPDGKQVIAVDLGTNELWFYNITSNGLKAADQQKLAMADGAGPRHLDFHMNGRHIYVLNELNGTITTVFKENNGTYSILNTISTLPADFKEFNKSADIHITHDGKFLYATNRGHNSIAIFSVDENEGLKRIGFESTRGEEPRNFKLSPNEQYLVVANQYSDKIVSFKRNAETGLLTFVDEINAPTPACILFE